MVWKLKWLHFIINFWKLFENGLYANQEEIGLKAAQPLTVHRKTASCDWAHNLRCTDTNQGLHSHIHVQKSWSSLFIQSQIICYVSCQCVWKSMNTIIEYFNIDYATIFNIFFFSRMLLLQQIGVLYNCCWVGELSLTNPLEDINYWWQNLYNYSFQLLTTISFSIILFNYWQHNLLHVESTI